MKTFKGDLFTIFDLLKSKTPFSFSKYADGEYAILTNQRISSGTETQGENWSFIPESDSSYQKELLDSFRFNEDGYYVGISCPCCVPMQHVNWMRENVGVPEDRLTWANIFVNGNYENFKKHFVPEFSNHEVIIVANTHAKINNLPFRVEEHIPIGFNASRENFNLVEQLSQRKDESKLYLLCAGPLGNMLAARMWKSNKNNIYLDIGSTLNPWLTWNNRGYLRGSNELNKICIW